MRRHNIIFWLFSLCAVVLSCTTDDAVSENTGEKRYEFVLSVGHQGSMRMATDIVQSEGTFRGIQKLWVIPFNTPDATAVTSSSFPLISVVMGSETNKVTRTDNEKFYYFAHCSLKETTNRVLVYGQAAPVTGYTDNDKNGILVTGVGEEYIKPSDIHFSLQSICETDDPANDVFEPARDLAAYLTAIANTEEWSTTTDSQMKGLYLDFINADTEGTGLMGGSAAHITAYVDELRTQLNTIKEATGTSDAVKSLCTNIIAVIENTENASCLSNNYPGSLGLPDGAAAVRWTGSEFEVRTRTTTLDNINGINRYTYPAELWYYANSAIMTSRTEVGESKYQTDAWSLLLSYYNQSEISVETKSVAVEDPLQYGVGHLQMTLKSITGTLKDAKDQDVEDGDAAHLPLTGMIVGGQHTVGFDFTPQGVLSDVDGVFIYDTTVSSEVTDGADAGDQTINTLVLQSYDDETVPVVLEFTNNTGHKFYGMDGVIYPGTKFYLIAQLDPKGKGTGDYANRVFTQDYTTAVTMRVTSLAKAYSCMPDLLEARLEIGVQIIDQWVQSTTTTVKL